MLKIFNTLGRELQEFKEIEKGNVRFYQCGPTVYSHQHIGNLRAAVLGDLVQRSLKYLGYNVNFVRNVTDVGHLVSDEDEGEDKLEKGARKEGLSPEQIAKKYLDIYHSDVKKLNVLDPDKETIATEYVLKMADMVQDLLDKGYAYTTDKAIYFDVSKFEKYNELNQQKLDKNIKGAGTGSEGDDQKKNSYDFALWFFKIGKHKNALQTWEYEYKGIKQEVKEGFPGWHIECSTMAKDVLGETIDIHMGGIEHIPVHHTNEIAQSEAVSGKKYVNYWLHNEHLLVNNGKMSKSEGTGFTLDEVIEKGYNPLVLRYFFLQAHYRSKQNFTWESLKAAQGAYEKLKKVFGELFKEVHDLDQVKVNQELKQEFIESLEDDFNIPKALAVVWKMIKQDLSAEEQVGTLLDFDKVFGFNLQDTRGKIQKRSNQEIPKEAKALIDERSEARKQKDFKKSDELRDRLLKDFGIKVVDTDKGQEVEFV